LVAFDSRAHAESTREEAEEDEEEEGEEEELDY
jgi:hypothetical protein